MNLEGAPEPSAPPGSFPAPHRFHKREFPEMKEIFPEKNCYHFFETEGRCQTEIYKSGVEFPFCRKHRYKYARMKGRLDFQTIPLTELQEDYLLAKLEFISTEFEFERKKYKRFRPTKDETGAITGGKWNQDMEDVLNEEKQKLDGEERVPAQGTVLAANLQDLDFVATQEMRDDRFHPYVPNRLQMRVGNLGMIANDRQNVHREDIRLAQNPMLFDLLKTNTLLENNTTLVDRISQAILELYKEQSGFFGKMYYGVFGLGLSARVKVFKVSLRQQMQTTERFSYLNPDTSLITRFSYYELATKMMVRILQSQNKKELSRRFLEEVVEGVGYCMTGKITRLLNVFTGFPEFVQVDLRTLTEKIQDVMAEINRQEDMTIREKKTRANMALSNLRVPLEERQVWLDAFGEDEEPLERERDGLRRRHVNPLEEPLLA